MIKLVKLWTFIYTFERWLNDEPYPKSVKDVQRYWKDLKEEYLKEK